MRARPRAGPRCAVTPRPPRRGRRLPEGRRGTRRCRRRRSWSGWSRRGVEDPRLSDLRARGECLDEEVGLDRGCEHGPVPLAHRWHDQAGRLPGLSRSDDHDGGALLGRDHRAAVVAERDPPALGPAHAELGEVGRRGPPCCPLARRHVTQVSRQPPRDRAGGQDRWYRTCPTLNWRGRAGPPAEGRAARRAVTRRDRPEQPERGTGPDRGPSGNGR